MLSLITLNQKVQDKFSSSSHHHYYLMRHSYRYHGMESTEREEEAFQSESHYHDMKA